MFVSKIICMEILILLKVLQFKSCQIEVTKSFLKGGRQHLFIVTFLIQDALEFQLFQQVSSIMVHEQMPH